jgi:hypothetical protein
MATLEEAVRFYEHDLQDTLTFLIDDIESKTEPIANKQNILAKKNTAKIREILDKDEIPTKFICILTFGNAFGKQMKRIEHCLQTIMINEYKEAIRTGSKIPSLMPYILSIDPEFAGKPMDFFYRITRQFETYDFDSTSQSGMEGSTPYTFEIMKTFNFDKKTQKVVTALKGYDSFTSRADTIQITGFITYVKDDLPSQYKGRDLEFTKQIYKDKSFAYADQCIPTEEYPFRQVLPFLKSILDLGGKIIVDNDAWHEVNDGTYRYLSNMYMEYYCEVMHLLRQINNPNVLFLHSAPKDINTYTFKPLIESFAPITNIQQYKQGGGTRHRKMRLRKRKSLKTRKHSKK